MRRLARSVPFIIVLASVAVTFSVSRAAPQSSSTNSDSASPKSLTVDRIYSQPSLSGRITHGLTWSPDSKQLSFFDETGTDRSAKTELWVMDAATGERRLLIPAEKLATV